MLTGPIEHRSGKAAGNRAMSNGDKLNKILAMKLRESGMPEEAYWETLLDVPLILDRLELTPGSGMLWSLAAVTGRSRFLWHGGFPGQ